MKPKQPRKRPPNPADRRVQRLLFYAQPHAVRRRHRDEARYEQCANREDLIYALVLRDGGYRCARCGRQYGLVIDHITPVSLGGKTELDNLQLLCREHDLEKQTEIIDYRPGREQE